MEYFKGEVNEPLESKLNSTKKFQIKLRWFLLAIALLIILTVTIVIIILSKSSPPENPIETIDFIIRNKNLSNYIIIPKSSSSATKFASTELQDYIHQSLNVTIPIITEDSVNISLINNSRSIILQPDLNRTDDGFHIKIFNGNLYISGTAERGILYGSYEILEKYLGIKWFSSWHTVIPKNKDKLSILSNIDDYQKPAIDYRTFSWYDTLMNYKFQGTIRMNRADEKHGGDPFKFGNGLGNCHTFGKLLPPEEFGETHPEYYALINGERKIDTQPCLSNPDVLKIMTERVLEKIKQDPKGKVFGISQNDKNSYCQCEKCKKIDEEEGSHAGTIIRFVNAIADEVKKQYPNILIETLAYEYSRTPTKVTKLRDNVVPCVCADGCDYSRGFEQSPYPGNAQFVQDLEGWEKQISPNGPNFLYIWNYGLNFENYPYPFANIFSFQDNVKFYVKHKVKAIFDEGLTFCRNTQFSELRVWLLAKLAWNPNLDFYSLLDEFFEGFYEKAAAFVKEYFFEIHKIQLDYSLNVSHPLKMFMFASDLPFTEEFLEKASLLFRQAEYAIKDSDPVYTSNLLSTSFGLDYLMATKDLTKYFFLDYEIPFYKEYLKKLEKVKYCNNIIKNSTFPLTFDDFEKRSGDTLNKLNDLANYVPVIPKDKKIQISSKDLTLQYTGRSERVDDKEGLDGQVIKLSNNYSDWSVIFYTHQVRGKTGRFVIKCRVKVVKKSGKEGVAFRAGIYDRIQKNYPIKYLTIKAQEVQDGWDWYELEKVEVSENRYFFIGANANDGKESAIEAVFIDRLEFEEVE